MGENAMRHGQDLPFGRKLLVRCPHCESRLIYTIDTAGYDAEVILNRRCPECEHRDSVVTTALAAAVWYRRDTRLLAELRSLADSLLGEIDALEQRPPQLDLPAS
jgi:DNA-directed RNA polymerase subunit RPC12/RpoP